MSAVPPATLLALLEELGLAQYAANFEQHAVDLELLPALSEAQLEQLGVKAVGHRVRLLRAAAAWAAPRAVAAAPPAAAPAAASAPPAPGAAERRQITVMFCDLVGSTALSQRLDPEDLRNLMQRYQRACGEVVSRHQGTVAQYLGDGLMVYFGWPRANEDDAQRAVLTALQVVDAVKAIDAAEPPRVRIGIATGPVVVGQGAEDGDASQPRMAVGETPNLAARVQAAAEPDQVLVAASTRRLLGDSFEFEDLGEHGLKGISAPVRLWRVLGESRAEGRFAAAHGAGLTTLVNRELEIALLLDRWARAQEGQGQAVLLAGEPGIGKSRVLAELCARVPAESLVVRLQSSELHVNSAFHPLSAQLVRAAGIERGDTPEARLDKLEALLERLGTSPQRHARYFAALLSLPPARYPALQSSPAKIRLETIDAFVQTVLDAARRRPVLVLAEDLHWMDPSSMEVLDALIGALRRARVLLVMSSRTPLGARWAAQPHVTALTMVGLSRSHSLQLAGSVAGAQGLGAHIVQRIVEHTDGVPLFLEELTRTLAEGATSRATEHADAIEIPSTLKDSLTARLDRLGSAKRVAQLGALLGRQFRHGVLQALHGADDDALAEQLEQIVAIGLLSRSGAAPDVVYTFHHALMQDTAYESMLKSERRRLHARAGDILREQFSDLAEHEPELLARHYAAGEAWDQAVPLWLKAGQRAWSRSAVKEAIAHLEAGLAAVDRVSSAAARDVLELGLQSTLGVVYFAAVSYAAPQAQAAFARASALCERIADAAMKVPVLYGMGAFQTMRGDARAGHRAFEQLRTEADACGQPRLQLHAHAVLAWSHYNLAEFEQSVAAAERVRKLGDSGAVVAPRLGAADPRIISECFRAVSLWALGHVDQARSASDGVLSLARTLSDPYSLAYTLNFAALLVPDYCGEHALLIERADEGIRLATELGYPFLEMSGLLWRSWTLAQAGDAAAALATFDGAMRRVDVVGVGYNRAQQLARRARLLLRSGDLGAAQLAVAQALGQAESSGNLYLMCDVHLAEGEVLLAQGGECRALAQAAFHMALDAARGQGARSWQLRAAMALARLVAEGEGPAAARALLEPLRATFTEGRDTADLKQAAALLAGWR
jgi:class 3 adenylate cyclase/predicted ATPase